MGDLFYELGEWQYGWGTVDRSSGDSRGILRYAEKGTNQGWQAWNNAMDSGPIGPTPQGDRDHVSGHRNPASEAMTWLRSASSALTDLADTARIALAVARHIP